MLGILWGVLAKFSWFSFCVLSSLRIRPVLPSDSLPMPIRCSISMYDVAEEGAPFL